jgi:iron complex outermembrane receptor protein
MTVGVSALLWGGALCAQQTQPATQVVATKTGSELEEVVVTARKREETLISVPVIVTAVPEERLQTLQTVSTTDLATLVPGLQFGRNLLSIGTQVSLRGIGSSSYDQGVDSSVALSIDDMEPGSGLAFQSGLFDLQRVEVLKGPQALFFGKSTPGGVIALHTADPTDKFEVIGTVSYEFEAKTNREEAIISGPVNDQLKLRLAAMYSTSEGYFYDRAYALPGYGGVTPSGDHTPHSTDYIVRGTLLWSPTDQLDVRLKLNMVHDNIINQESSQFKNCPQGPNFAPVGIPFLGLNTPCGISRNNYVVWMDPNAYPGIPALGVPGIIDGGVPQTDHDQRFGILELNYRPTQDLTITSVTTDYLLLSTDLVNAIETYSAAPPLVAENFFRRWDLTQELRLNSNYSGPLNFTVGGFYEDGLIDEHVQIPGNTALPLIPGSGLPLRVPGVLAGSINPVTITTYSAYGQLRFKILPKLELAAGARYTDEKRTESPVSSIPVIPTINPIPSGEPIPVARPTVKSINTAPEVTVTWRPTDDLTAYGAYKQGYKSGSFVLSTPPTPGEDNSFNEEKAQGGEVGLKGRWFDHRLAVNTAAYLYNYSGLQVGAISPAVNGIPVIQTVNAGAARSYGVDLDAAWNPAAVQALILRGSALWNHARYVTLDNVPCWGGQTIALGCNQILNPQTGLYTAQNLNGTPLLRAPTWQFNLGFDYNFNLPANYSLLVSNNNSGSTDYRTALSTGRPNHDNIQTGYVKVDLSLTLSAPDNKWQLAVVGKNLNDKITAGTCAHSDFGEGVFYSFLGGQTTGGNTSGPAGIDQTNCFVDPGREVWLRLTVRPFGSHE